MAAATPTDDDAVIRELPWLRRLARRLATDDADDLVHETWMLARRDRPVARAPDGLRPWLATAMRNRWRSLQRSSESRRRREAVLELGEDAGVEARVLEADVIRVVDEALAELGDEERALLRERFFGERTAVEIADELGIPAATVRTRIRRSLLQLRSVLDERHGNDRRRWAPAVLAVPAPRSLWRGTITMASIKGLVAAGALVGAVALGWMWSSDDGGASASTEAAGAAVAQAVTGTAEGERNAGVDSVVVPPLTKRIAASEVGPGRRGVGVAKDEALAGDAPRPRAPGRDAVLEACAFDVHEHEQECDFLEPDDATLELMAKCGVVRYDFPTMFAKADELPAFDDQWLGLVGATLDERGELNEIGDAFRDELFRGLEALAEEAGLPAWPTDVTLLTAVVDLNKHYGDDAMMVSSTLLARERAGLAEPPESLEGRPAVERFLRLFTQVGDDFEASVARRLGAARAHELRMANDGWPGLKFQTGRNQDCR